MKKQDNGYSYTGSLKGFLSNKIYINVTYLKKGVYEINIVYRKKIIKKITFEK